VHLNPETALGESLKTCPVHSSVQDAVQVERTTSKENDAESHSSGRLVDIVQIARITLANALRP
jgi:hypothetical protein